MGYFIPTSYSVQKASALIGGIVNRIINRRSMFTGEHLFAIPM